MTRLPLLVCAAAVALVGCSQQPAPPPFKPVADVKTLMDSVIDPTADIIWDSVAITVTAAGTEDHRPHTDEEWAQIRNAAVLLTESGNLLMMVPRARDGDHWMEHATALVGVGEETQAIVGRRDVDGLYAIGEKIDEVCENCHKEYYYDGAPRKKP